MNDVIAQFTIPGEPASKERPRTVRRNGKAHTYTPQKTLAAEQVVALRFRAAAGPHQPDTNPYTLTARFISRTRRRRDIDNMLKLILDALNGVAWADDTQVTELHGTKEWTATEDARTEVTVWRVAS